MKNKLTLHDSKSENNEPHKLYNVSYKITRRLTTYTEPDDYIYDILGEITCMEESDAQSDETIAGTMKGYIINVDRILEDGESLFEACDAHSQTIHDYSCVLFDFRSGELKRAIDDQFGNIINRDVLILDRVEVLPAYRGRGVGLAAVCSFLDTFENGRGLAVGEPCPLQFKEMTPAHAEWCKEMGVDAFVTDKKRATAKLRAYWSRLGFQRIRGSKKYALSLEHWRPTLLELAPNL